MTYVDGFVAPVPTANREKFKRRAEEAADVFKENGALKVVECWGDDVPEGRVTSFPMAVRRQPDETVIFSWIVWPSREVRDKGMKALMADPRMQPRHQSDAVRRQAHDLWWLRAGRGKVMRCQ
jgi:uncharacterized protein YbaA (DUF1428 family)